MAWQNEETYVYDETNHMVDGKNEKGERSLYTYNGLGLRVGRELIMQDNTHGYTDFHDETPSVETGINKPEVAVESYVIDYTSPTFRTLVMEEEGGFDYRWVYGLDKLSVKITSEGTNWWGQNVKQDILKDYLHQDRLGSTTNLSDKFGRVVGRADYNEWGEITYKDALDITSAYRRIYPQLNYTGHDWDDVLEMYYAKARFYDPDAKRFVEIDPVKGQVTDPLSLVSYLYCVDNPLRWVDPLGLYLYKLHSVNGKVQYYELVAENDLTAFRTSVELSLVPGSMLLVLGEQYNAGIRGGNGAYMPDIIEVIGTAKDMNESVVNGFLKVAGGSDWITEVAGKGIADKVKKATVILAFADTAYGLLKTGTRLAEDDTLFDWLDSLDSVTVPGITNWNRRASSVAEMDNIISTIRSVIAAHQAKPEYAWFYKEPFIKLVCSDGDIYSEVGFESLPLASFAYDAYHSSFDEYTALQKHYVDTFLLPAIQTSIHKREHFWDMKIFFTEDEQQQILDDFYSKTNYYWARLMWIVHLREIKQDVYQALREKGYIQ